MELTNEQWSIVETILPSDAVRADGRGRPWSDRRIVFNGILWVLRTGAPWKDLPSRYGPYQTAHRRFQNWVRDDTIEKVLLVLADHLREAGGLDLRMFCGRDVRSGQKRGRHVAKPSGARAPKS